MRRPIVPVLLLSLLPLVGIAEDPRPAASTGTHIDLEVAGDGAIDVRDGRVIIKADDIDDRAQVGVDGRLRIGRRDIAVDGSGQRALRDYARAAVAMHAHGRALGRAGAHFGIDVLADILSGLIDGEPQAASDRARAGAADFVASVMDFCERMDTLESAQRTVAARVPAFRPYAVIEPEQVEDCRRELEEARADLSQRADEQRAEAEAD